MQLFLAQSAGDKTLHFKLFLTIMLNQNYDLDNIQMLQVSIKVCII